ncbi:hypothetical protein [Algibacter lectus]|uniref:Uncharacterized protein n=1 Tax=Algibacter lectus TaxID=221126 RepID=A0A090VL82_9FLAO|nr:hypothetical protein [Algibacter lectus]GAL64818.1 hypothetical protein JCM19300_3138 [Algibacter lectus]
MAINFGFDGSSKNNDGVQEIPSNKSLLIQKLTDLPPLLPEVVKGLQNTEAVFQHFKPSVNVVFDNLDKGMVKETIRFTDMLDFEVEKIVSRSEFLTELELKKRIYFDIVNKLQNNSELKELLKNKDSKTALLKKIQRFKKRNKKLII